MKTKLHLVLSITILFFSFSGFAQADHWKRAAIQSGNTRISHSSDSSHKTLTYSLNENSFFKELTDFSKEGKQQQIFYFPTLNGELAAYQITERPIFSAELSKKYPRIKSFSGYRINDRTERIRFSISPKGFQAIMRHGNSNSLSTLIEKQRTGDGLYRVFSAGMGEEESKAFSCFTKDVLNKEAASKTFRLVNDQTLRIYRIAVSASGEYTQYHGGTIGDALGAINATLTRVNELFETDLGVQLELIANTEDVIYTNPVTDPYNGNLNAQIQSTLTSVIGEANYDVGHLFHQDVDSGNAGFIGSVCRDNQKGSAYSQALVPEGEVFDLDYVAHELGHQFGANHTWSFESEGTSVQAEPASGTTIMGYAGIVPGNNVQDNGDGYFHYYSIFQISEYLKNTSCGTFVPLTNNPPEIQPLADYVIPKGTAFVLNAEATDIDPLDILTYTWEQIDDGVVTADNFGPQSPSGANFRSQRPSLDSSRYFPAMTEILQGNLTQRNPTVNSAWETVSNVEREMNFALTVRDNAMGGGQVTSALLRLNVINDSGPFEVLSQEEPQIYTAGSVQTISWDVASTNVAPISAQMVDIFLSIDGGLTYPFELVENTPNDGEQDVIIPGNISSTARVMVKASNNVFFSVNKADFQISPTDIVLNFPSLEYVVCSSNNLDVSFVYETYNGFSEEVTFEALDLPVGLDAVFNPLTATDTATPVNLQFSNTALVTPGVYPIRIRATSLSTLKEVSINLTIQDILSEDVLLTAPANNAREISPQAELSWEASPNVIAYDIEIAEDLAFSNIVDSASDILFNTYTAQNLQQQTVYYWRVKPKNNCGEGNFGQPFQFTTITISCDSVRAIDVPIEISAIGTPTVTSRVSFFNDLPVSDIDVVLDIEHTFLADLIITLTSPSGTSVTLTSNSCGNLQNIDAIFDDDGEVFSCDTTGDIAIKDVIRPLGSLASFNGESAFGEWILTVEDTAPADGGSINTFTLDICVEGAVRPDEDQDGVFDDGDDLCLGTPLGLEVDTNGCPVYRFMTDNFSVVVESETCINNNDGRIEIDAKDAINYSVTVTGNGVSIEDSFVDTYILENLAAGVYNFCINGSDGIIDYEELCLEIVISEPQPLQVNSLISVASLEATLSMQGAELYNVELNGVLQQVVEPELVLSLKPGVNSFKVSTGLACQGVYTETVFVADEPFVFPNPVRDVFTIFLGAPLDTVATRLFSIEGRLVIEESRNIDGDSLEMDVSGLSKGVYLLELQGAFGKKTFKIIKR